MRVEWNLAVRSRRGRGRGRDERKAHCVTDGLMSARRCAPHASPPTYDFIEDNKLLRRLDRVDRDLCSCDGVVSARVSDALDGVGVEQQVSLKVRLLVAHTRQAQRMRGACIDRARREIATRLVMRVRGDATQTIVDALANDQLVHAREKATEQLQRRHSNEQEERRSAIAALYC